MSWVKCDLSRVRDKVSISFLNAATSPYPQLELDPSVSTDAQLWFAAQDPAAECAILGRQIAEEIPSAQ